MKYYKNGIVVGKFAPLTRGHINLINHASTQCDNLTVLLCYDEKFLSEQNERDKKTLTLRNRLFWLKKTFSDFSNINIDYIDETEVPKYPNGWKGYTDLIREKFNNKIPNNTAIFSSENDYDEGYKKYLPEIDHVIVDYNRTMVPISATKIRENIYDNWDMIPSIVRKDYALKVCIIGTESCGKSTMVKYLSKLFNTSWVEEYGRTYIENEICSDETLLKSEDYSKIAFGHKMLEEEALKTSNKLVFIDTNAFVTNFYHNLYEGKDNNIVKEIAKNEEYDLIFYLNSDVPWVSDNIRINGGEKRKSNKKLFEKLLNEYPNIKDNMVIIDGSNYNERLSKCMNHVNKLLESVSNGKKYRPKKKSIKKSDLFKKKP